MRTKNLGLVRTCPAYPEQYNVVYIPTDNFFRELFNMPVKPVTVGYIRHRGGVTECYAVINDEISLDNKLYEEKFNDKLGDATIPISEFARVTKECMKRIVKFYRFRKIK